MIHMTNKINHQSTKVAIIGAGFGGIAMAIRLLQQGIQDFVILEKGSEVGGTWRDNQYPGAACDVQSHMYSLSFAAKADWSKRYADASEIFTYIQSLVDDNHLSSHIRLNSEVQAARYQQQSCLWQLSMADGSDLQAQYVVFASGPLHVPQIPAIRGIENFQGKAFHSAQWDHDYDLTGKNIVSIGTGGSAIQYVPQIAKQAKKLYVFQRSAAWIIPRDDRPYLKLEQNLFARFNAVRKLHRARLYWSNESRAMPIMQPVIMKYAQKLATAFIQFQVKDKSTAAKLTPNYIMGCKRILISNNYYPTFNRDNVELVTESIREIKAHSIVTQDGQERPVDCLIYGTGFITDPRIYLKEFVCTGLNGLELKEAWQDGAESYYGVATKNFPNLFQLLGPNTVLAHNSVIFMIESQVNYILQMMQLVEQSQSDAIVVKDDVQDDFNDQLQRKMKHTVWASGCVSWYQNAQGKNFTLWPNYTWKYWLKTKKLNAADYRLLNKAS